VKIKKLGGSPYLRAVRARLFFQAMTRAVTLPSFESAEVDVNSTLNVVIAYEDFETGTHAKKTYDFLVANLAHDCQFFYQMWKFEVLSIPQLREIAAKDAANADLIMLSCHGHALPPEVMAWLEFWLGEPNHAVALVALFTEPHIVATAEVREYLASVATRGQLEFFAQPGELPDHPKQSGLRLPRNSELDVPILKTAVEHEISFPRWGISE